MMTKCIRTGLLLLLLNLSLLFLQAQAQDDTGKLPVPRETSIPLEVLSNSKNLKNGLEVRSGKALLSIVALRDDVLRIRIAVDGQLSEDASWAVLSEARASGAEVIADNDARTIGFHTKALRIELDRATLRMRLTNLQGEVLQEDEPSWPVEFHGDSFQIHKKMPLDEHYFGLGDKAGPLDRRNQSFILWNTDAFHFQESTDPIYKSIPFFLTMRHGKSIGVLMDNTWCSSFDFGRAKGGVYSFGADGGAIDYYVIYGPEPKQVVTTYAWLTGTAPLPPLWSLGYQQSRYSYETEARVREIANRLRSDHIPADALYLDIDFQQNNRPFTVDPVRFPHFEQMLADLKKQNFRVVAITDLHIADLPDANYVPYNSGVKTDSFVKNANGSTYVGEVWPGPAVFPDFTQKKTRDWWGTLYQPFVSQGVAGFWNDMNEPSVFKTPTMTMPLTVQHRIEEPGFQKRTTTHSEIHNVYGMENSRATYEGLLKLQPDVRPFVLTRATYAGGQRYAATWTGDNTSTWNHLRLSVPMLLNLGLSGFGITGADVGGFIGTPNAELLTKWTELATFQPLDRNHTNKGGGDKEPWVHGSEQLAIRRKYIEERYRLLPYLYTAVEEYTRTGVPVVRPLFLEFPNATAGGDLLDLTAGSEFMFGADLLIAPSPFPEQPDAYDVKFPAGEWYDYWSGEKLPASANKSPEGNKIQTIQPKLEVLPVYVREGSILPLEPLTQSTEEIPDGPLTLRIFPGKDCHGSLYLDDGKSLGYKKGDYLRLKFSCDVQVSGLKIHIQASEGNYRPWWKTVLVQVYGWSAACIVTMDGKAIPSVQVDVQHHEASFSIPNPEHGAEIDLRAR